MKKLFLLCVTVFAMLLTLDAYAQDHEILRLKDGTEITGTIERLPDGGVRITDLNGDIFVFSADEIATITSSQREMRKLKNNILKLSHSANNRKTEIPSTSKENKRYVGIRLGYVSKQLSSNGQKIPWMILNTAQNNKKYSPSFQIGLEYSPVFKYGIGLQTGVLYEFCTATYSNYSQGYETGFSSKEHNLSIPLRIRYSHEITQDFRIFIFTGPSFDISLAYNSELYLPSLGYYEHMNMFEELGINRFNLTWGIGGGVSWKFISINLGCDWGLLPIIQNDGSLFKLNKPFYIALGFLF